MSSRYLRQRVAMHFDIFNFFNLRIIYILFVMGGEKQLNAKLASTLNANFY